MVTKSDAKPVQIEIFPNRFLKPETAQRLLSEIYKTGGITRVMIQGPNLPQSIPYGPGRGLPVEENRDLLLEIGKQALELRVKVGRIWLELLNEEYIEEISAACERALPFSFGIKKGTFFRTKSTVSDYAKFGTDIEDERILGLVDPKAKLKRDLAILSDDTR
jgi:methyl-coenzyme M reductase subunit D